MDLKIPVKIDAWQIIMRGLNDIKLHMPRIDPGISHRYVEPTYNPHTQLDVPVAVEAILPHLEEAKHFVQLQTAMNPKVPEVFNQYLNIPNFNGVPPTNFPEMNPFQASEMAKKYFFNAAPYLPKPIKELSMCQKVLQTPYQDKQLKQLGFYLHYMQNAYTLPEPSKEIPFLASKNIDKFLDQFKGLDFPNQLKILGSNAAERLALRQKILCEIRALPYDYLRQEDSKRYLEEALIHPLIEKYLPLEVIKSRSLALDLSILYDAFWVKVNLLIEDGQIHNLKYGQDLLDLMDKGIERSADWVESVLLELIDTGDSAGCIIENVKSGLSLKLGAGYYHLRLIIREQELSRSEIFKSLGYALFGPSFVMKPAFNVGRAFISNKAESHIDREILKNRALELRKMPGLEEVFARVNYYSMNPEGDSLAFSPQDFMVKSIAIDIGIKELKNGGILNVNGILNSFKEAERAARKFSLLGDHVRIKGIYNASNGFKNDILESLFNLLYISTPPVELLKEQILDYFEKNGLEKRLLIQCHSQGAAITRNALMQLPPQIRNRISVLAISPAAYIDREICGDVKHVVSDRDWIVPYIDKAGLERCIDTVTFLKSKKPFSFLDHGIESPTFQEVIEATIKQFCKENE